nr:hypothetical protein [Flavobacteriales bacterium]
MRRVLAGAVFLCFGGMADAQVDEIPRDVIEQRIEAASDQLGDDSSVDLTSLFDKLSDHLKDPIDLNHTDAQELNGLI